MRATLLELTAPARDAAYLCPACDGRWSYAEVRHVFCCPECGGGLLRLDHDGRGAPIAAGGGPIIRRSSPVS